MFKNRIAVTVLLSLPFTFAKADEKQSIEVINNSDHSMNIGANSKALNVIYAVPAYLKSLLTFQIAALQTPQDRLFEAILNDSAEDVLEAIRLGADINCPREGKAPLFWAITLNRSVAGICLIDHGAIG